MYDMDGQVGLALSTARPMDTAGVPGDDAADVIPGKTLLLPWREARATGIVTVRLSRDKHNTCTPFSCHVIFAH